MARGLPHRAALVAAAGAVGLLVGVRAPAGDAPALPPAPQWVRAAETRGRVELTWVRAPAFAKVRVYRRTSGAGVLAPIGESPENVFTDDDVVPGSTYAYRLRGVSAAGVEGPPSMEIVVRVVAATLLPPVPPEWEGYLPVEGGVGLRWSAQPGRDVIAFNVYRRAPPDPEYVLVGSTATNSYRAAGLEPQRPYLFALTALDSSLRETARSADLEVVLAGEPRFEPGAGAPPAWQVRRTRPVALVEEGEGAPLLRPADVAAGALSGDFYLADSGRRLVLVYSREGVFRRSIGAESADGPGAFRNLLGLATDARENLYAVDAGRGGVQVYASSGRPGRLLRVPAPEGGGPSGVIDAAVAPDGTLHVVDNRASRLVVMAPQGGVRIVGGPGGQPGAFSAPTFCAFGPDGLLRVADALNGRVQVVAASGEAVRAFGAYRRGPGGLARPKGVAVNALGETYVADSWLNVVQVFDGEGRFVAVLGDEAGVPLDLGSPNGVALSRDGRTVAIAERLAARLRIVEVVDGP